MNQTAKTGYDLEERTSVFGENVIQFCRKLPVNSVTRSLVDQIVRSATSIGANYMEANNASSKRDFRNKIYLSKKECQETKHWFRMLGAAIPEKKPEIRVLWQECHELTLIFQKIGAKLSANV